MLFAEVFGEGSREDGEVAGTADWEGCCLASLAGSVDEGDVWFQLIW